MLVIKRVLFIGESNLGKEGEALVREFYPNASSVFWDPGDDKDEVRKFIRSNEPWDLTLSFYSNLVFESKDLDCMRLPCNFHPSSPQVPGVGYDTIPLVENHQKNAATAHFMNEDIDAGRIFRVCESRLAQTATYLDLRKSNQKLVLQVLRETLEEISALGSVESVKKKLCSWADELNLNWGSTYYSYKDVRRVLTQLYEKQPNHPVFIGNDKFKKASVQN